MQSLREAADGSERRNAQVVPSPDQCALKLCYYVGCSHFSRMNSHICTIPPYADPELLTLEE